MSMATSKTPQSNLGTLHSIHNLSYFAWSILWSTFTVIYLFWGQSLKGWTTLSNSLITVQWEVFRKGFVLFSGNKFIFWKALSTLRATGSWRVELIKPLCAAPRSRQGHDISICVFKTPCKLYVFLEVTGLRYAFCHLRESSMKYSKKC